MPYAPDALDDYISHLRRIPLLTHAQEQVLTQAAANGDTAAREHLITANLRLVIDIAKRYRGCGVEFADLIQDGNAWLIKAADSFEPARGVRFSTHATWWVRHGVGRAVETHSRTIRLPTHVHRSNGLLRRSRMRLLGELQREPTEQELADALGVKMDKIKRLLADERGTLSLDKVLPLPGSQTHPVTLGDVIKSSEDTTAQALHEVTLDSLRRALEALDEAERALLTLRYGLGNREPLDLKPVARQMGITPWRARVIERTAMEKLRQMPAFQEVV